VSFRFPGPPPAIAITRKSAPDEDLGVARPSVVFGLGCDAVIARRHERSIDDPRAAPIQRCTHRRHDRCDSLNHVSDDAMCLRARDGEHGCELAHGEVGAQARAGDDDTLLKRECPRPAPTYAF
jgi:hypothetical protein